MMSFLYPLFLAGSIAIALPIALHLLRRDIAPDVPFTAVRLLRQSPVERVHRRSLRDLLLLLARIAALLLLAAAFARPYIQGAAAPNLRIVAIDRSFSMGGGDRFARALERARAAIDAAPGGERVAVIAFDDRADLLAEPGSAADARLSLTGLQAGFGATRYSTVFDRVEELASGAPGRLVVVTDLQQSGWGDSAPPTLPAGWELEVQDVGPAAANVALTSIAVEPTRVRATIANSGSTGRSGNVRMLLDDRLAASGKYTVGPGATTDVSIPWQAPAAGGLKVAIDDPGGLAADDERFAIVGGSERPKVLVVGSEDRGGLFLVRALGSSGRDDVEVTQGSRLAEMSADRVSSYAAIALMSTRGLDRRGRDLIAAYVTAGGGLLIAASPDLDPAILATVGEWQPALSAAEHGERTTLAATDLRHPIFRPFGALAANLGQVRFDRTWNVAPEGWSVIGRFSNGSPALLERNMGQGRVVLFASDLDRRWNDFPLHPSFVPFAIEATRYVAGDRPRPGTYLVADVPAGVEPRPGIIRQTDGRLVAVNVDPGESLREPTSVADFMDRVATSAVPAAQLAQLQARQTEAQQGYWQYGLLVMLAALVAESIVGRS